MTKHIEDEEPTLTPVQEALQTGNLSGLDDETLVTLAKGTRPLSSNAHQKLWKEINKRGLKIE